MPQARAATTVSCTLCMRKVQNSRKLLHTHAAGYGRFVNTINCSETDECLASLPEYLLLLVMHIVSAPLQAHAGQWQLQSRSSAVCSLTASAPELP